MNHRVDGVGPGSGRLRFSLSSPDCDAELRLMVLDEEGQVQHRMTVQPTGPSVKMQLTGFPRGRVYLVCAFLDDELAWSAPVSAG